MHRPQIGKHLNFGMTCSEDNWELFLKETVRN